MSKIKFNGTQGTVESDGMVSANELVKTDLTGTDSVQSATRLTNTSTSKGHVTMELYDSSDTLIGTSGGQQGSVVCNILLTPVANAAAEGDNGSNAPSVKWKVSPDNFSTGKFIIRANGKMDSIKLRFDIDAPAGTGTAAYEIEFNGGGSNTIELPFEVLA